MDRLFSKLFADDQRLQDCLVKDSAHVTRGCRGDYVGKLQYALLVLQGGKISGRELEERLYGPDTAKLVLAYKTRLGIINRSYQVLAGRGPGGGRRIWRATRSMEKSMAGKTSAS